jgi:hypothetical protein
VRYFFRSVTLEDQDKELMTFACLIKNLELGEN